MNAALFVIGLSIYLRINAVQMYKQTDKVITCGKWQVIVSGMVWFPYRAK